MAKQRKKPLNKDEDVFRLEEENRELKRLNRSLLKQLKKKSKGKFRGYQLDLEEKEDEREEVESVKSNCESCGKGATKEIQLGPKRILVCILCKWRSKAYD